MADNERKSVLADVAEQATLKIYSFGRGMRESFPDASKRLGAFFSRSEEVGHYMRRDGWSGFTSMVSRIGSNIGEFYMKATSTRAGAIATGIAGGLGVLGVYFLTPAPALAVTAGVFTLMGSIGFGGMRAASSAFAGMEASGSIRRSREWESERRYGDGDGGPSWSEYFKRAKDNQETEFLSPDDPAHWRYDEETSAGKSWLSKRPSEMGRHEMVLGVANLVMWSTNPAGAIMAASCVFGPRLLFAGLEAGVGGLNVARDGFRMLSDQVGMGIDAAKAKIEEKQVRDRLMAEKKELAGEAKVQTVEFTDPGHRM